MSTLALEPGSKVLVTGVTGYIGGWIGNELLKLGYKVRGSARSLEKVQRLQTIFATKYGRDAFEISLVEDSVSGVVHVAGGFSEIIDIDESIRSEVAAIKDILADAAATGSVKRFVYTSSALAVSSPTVNEVFTYEQGLWNDRSIQQAHKKPKDPYPDQSYINFAACRTSSEHAIWRFVREQNPGFALNTVLPNFTMGPAPILEGISGNTRGFFRGLIHNVEGDVKILQALGSQYWVNVEDVALVHIGALIYEDVKEERLLTFPPNGKYSYNGWVDIASERYPLRTDGPPKIADPGPDLSSVDDRRALELLRRLGREGWTGWEETLRASLE